MNKRSSLQAAALAITLADALGAANSYAQGQVEVCHRRRR
jgi:hypothetical protein